VRGDAFRSEELQRLWREGKAGCSAVIAQLNELYRTMLTKQWYPEAMRKLQEAHRAEMDAEGALGVPQRLDGRGVCHQSSLQESATEAAVRTLDAAAKNFEASFETKVLAPFRTNVDAIVALNESTWLGLAAQDDRLKAIKEQLLAEVSNVTRLTHTFWDDLLRAPLDEEARFNMTRFPAFVDALVTQLTTTKKEDASSKQKLLFKHIAHALDLDEPNSMLVIRFNAQGETQVRLPGMGNLLGFLFGRGSTSISEDIESEIRKAAELVDQAKEATASRREEHVEQRIRIEHAHQQIANVMSNFSEAGSYELDDVPSIVCALRGPGRISFIWISGSEEDSVAHTSDEEFIVDEDDEESGQGDDGDEL